MTSVIPEASTATPEPRAQRKDDDTRLTYLQAAVFITNQLEAEAVKTADPAKTLGNILDALPEVMPQVFQKMGTAQGLVKALQPEVADRLQALRDIYAARAEVGTDFGYVFEVMADAMRRGASAQAMHAQVPGVLQRVRAEKAARIEGHVDRIMATLREAKPEVSE
ncbi:hypothetical protein ABZU94_29895 [Streptomyces mirabilis]|uniref:hypothetical protein n=1 Tax=Streptomyces sp. NPDC005388 TaxID=3156717 RepID=UPI0033A3D98F